MIAVNFSCRARRRALDRAWSRGTAYINLVEQPARLKDVPP
jgi:hypothetical protein